MLHLKLKIFALIGTLLLVMLIAIATVTNGIQSNSHIKSLPLLELAGELTKIQTEQTLWLERCWQSHQTEKYTSAKNNFHNRTALINSKLNDFKFLINQRDVYTSGLYNMLNKQLIAVNQQYIGYESSAVNTLQLLENNQNIGKFKQQLEYQEKNLDQELTTLYLKIKEIIELSTTNNINSIYLWLLIIFVGIFGVIIAFLLSRQIITQIGAEPNVLVKMSQQIAIGNINIHFDNTKITTGVHKALCELIESVRIISKQTSKLAKGDCSLKITPRSEQDVLGNALITVNERLREISTSIQAAINGDYSKKITNQTKEDIFGQNIAQIIDKLQQVTDASQKSDWLKTGQTKLNEIMRGEQDLNVLTQNIINYLANYVNAQTGIFFLAEGDSFKLNSSYAYKQRTHNDIEFKSGEGLVGQAAFEKKSIIFNQVAEEHISIISGLGKSQPTTIFIIPLLYEQQVLGILELAASHNFTATEIELLDQVADNIAISIHSAKSRLRMQALLDESQQLTQNLQSQQHEMMESEERIRAIVDTVVDAIITIDEQGVIDTFNPAAEQIFGYSWSEVVGQNVNILMPEPYHGEHDQYLANYITTGTANAVGKRRELTAKRRDGTTFPIDIAVDEMPLDEKRMFIGIIRDISEQKQVEAALQEQQEELQASNEELQAQQEQLQANNEELQTQQEELQAANEELQAQQEELRIANNVLEDKTIALENSKQDLETKAKALEMSTKYKSEFLANMSHELRTPLNSMLILAQLLADNKDKHLTDKQVEYAKTIHNAGSELLLLINDILDLSKVEAGKMPVNLEDVSLIDFVENIDSKFRHVAEDSNLGLEINITENIPKIWHTDIQRLNQIITNLLSNAFKFTKQGGIKLTIHRPAATITLNDTYEPNTAIAISVIDTGIGIPEQKLQEIFEAFKQVDGTTSRNYGGTGLGLSISRQLAKLLGGELHLTSKENHGSTFTLYLNEMQTVSSEVIDEKTIIASPTKKPIKIEFKSESEFDEPESTVKEPIVEEDEEYEENIADDRNELVDTDKIILIVDDDYNFSDILMELSQEKGFKCIRATDGKTGLKLAEKYHPHAIILDIGLPQLDGWSVMERLKDNPETRHIPVHFMSAAEQERDAKQMGAIGYLLKPINMEQLGQAFKKIERFVTTTIKSLLLVADDETRQGEILDIIGDDDVQIELIVTKVAAIQKLHENQFDCVVVDIDVEDGSGIQLIKQLCHEEELSQVPVIIYSNRDLNEMEENIVQQCSDNITVKSVSSPARLLDETTLFLHQLEAKLSQKKRNLLRSVHDSEAILRHKTVLIADDDMRNVFSLVAMLEDKDMEIVVAKNGQEAIDALEENPQIAAIIMDVMMPGVDGYEAMRTIRKQSNYRKLPIIALTAKAMKDDRAKCIDAGANDYLPKPVDNDKLISLLRVWLYH
ncbi:response regulator [Candidatus Halobeggiatoa sp. HSG11]|nr:response regulator [Candidatus Halobeggiatoa sp. HSG11]